MSEPTPQGNPAKSRGHSTPSPEALEYARAFLAQSREELVRADSKAALLLAASGVAIGALLNGLIGVKWSPLQLGIAIGWLWWLGVVAATAALISLAAAIYPTTRRSSEKPRLAAYYGDVIALGRDELEQNLSVTPARLYSALLDQIYTIALIVARKYRLLRIAIFSFAFAATCCTGSVLVDLLLRPGR